MAFKNGLSERLDELRFTSPRSPPSESSPFSGYTSPPRGQANFMTAFQQPSSNDVRANMQRRFTTDSSKHTWPSFSQQTTQLPEAPDLLSSFEKKRQHIEYMREQKKRFEADMKLLDQQQEKERHELDQMARNLANVGIAGPVSEPTTPPENNREAGFPTAFSRPTRFSTSSVTTSAGLFNVFAPSQSITSPPASQVKTSASQTPNSRFSAQSTPGSRRNSEEEYFPENFPTSRPAQSSNRYSMPTTSLASHMRSNTSAFTNSVGMNSLNTSKYVFGEEQDDDAKEEDRFPTPDIKTYLQLTDPDDRFPTLIRQDDHSGLLSANSAALDLANSKTPGPEPWNTHTRHRSSHQSLPQNALNMFRVEQQLGSPPSEKPMNNIAANRHLARHSLEVSLGGYGDAINGNGHVHHDQASNRPASLQSSYSTNDLPTVKGNGLPNGSNITPPNSHAEHFHKHNASLGRIPPNAIPRQKDNSMAQQSPEREVDNGHLSQQQQQQQQQQPPIQSALQASAAPFGPQLPSATSPSIAGSITPTPLTMNSFPSQFYGYGLQPYMGNTMPINGQAYPPQAYSAYPTAAFNNTYPQFSADKQGRRNGEGDGPLSRFSNVPLEHYKGELYSLCKDQHGCRYLQRKLEDRDPEHVQMIFVETHRHVVELMTDPFGNYLCQKLLEYSNDEQRTSLIDNAAPQLVKIALNQHGTRALQKMIEFISTPGQTQTVIRSLRDRVVDLVQDLNGNHVIQKCLNRLSAEDAQFIYDAVGAHCVIVGTHRHGCCVLQRCIDHASGEQRARLIAQITSNAFALVQDPFGNYVVQYILDLAEPHFTEPLCQTFRGNIPALSKQKFSSNVIEKCLRTAAYPVRRALVEEMLVASELEKMLRDSFANYVVQTAMDFADPETKTKLVEAIRPILPSIRQTPHGRRIAGKMMGVDGAGSGPGRLSGASSGQITPNDMTSGQIPTSQQFGQQKLMYGAQAGQNSFSQNNFLPQGSQFSENMNMNSFMSVNGGSSANTPSTGDANVTPTIFSPTPVHPNTGGGYF